MTPNSMAASFPPPPAVVHAPKASGVRFCGLARGVTSTTGGKVVLNQRAPGRQPLLELLVGGVACCGALQHARGSPRKGWLRSRVLNRFSGHSLRQRLQMRSGAQAVMERPETKTTLSEDIMTVVRFVVPGIGTALLAPMLDTTDAAVIGRFGSVVDLAALSPAMAACDMTGLLFTFLAAVTAKKMALARGSNDYALARATLADICCLAVCCGLAISAFMLLNCHGVLGALVSPTALAAIAGPAAAYIGVRAMAFPVQMLQLVLSAACASALQDTVTPLRATAVGGLVNLALDVILIAGFGWGTVGAATATVSGQVIAVALLVRALRINRGFNAAGKDSKNAIEETEPLLPSPVAWLRSLRPARMLPLIRFAAPFMSFQMMQVLLMSFETRMGSAFGALSLAAHQITYSIWRPLICLGDPIMQAALSLVPTHLARGGASGRAGARRLAQAILVVAAGLGLSTGVLGFALGKALPTLFTADLAVAKEAAGLALPMMLSVMGLSIWHCNQGLMLATGRAKLLAVLYAWNVFYFVSGSTFVLTRGLQLYHSWYVFATMHIIFSLIISVVLRLPGGVFSKVQRQQPEAPAAAAAA
mmetsp:Transcript_23493/g.58456  ORF Transcript_23493/g.58456 Transcript_23493/m.58456 type:complete len:591 (-) Transcript_23493:107-1879(-)